MPLSPVNRPTTDDSVSAVAEANRPASNPLYTGCKVGPLVVRRVAGQLTARYADFHTRWTLTLIDGASVSKTPAPIPDFSQPGGLITAVAQDAATGKVLMVAHMNREAWDETLASGRAVYFSRSRNKLWRKGEESGNVQQLRAAYVDCDGDAVLLVVEQVGGSACHEGYPTCFFRQITPEGVKVVADRVFDPNDVYGKK